MEFKFSLYKKHEFLGLWEDPETPGKKVVGLLKYDPIEGISLELEDSFKRQSNKFIRGIASGTEITIVNCFASTWNGSEFNFGLKYAPSHINASVVLIGASVRNFPDFSVEQFYFKTDDIKQWSQISGFEGSLPYPGEKIKEINFNYRLLEPTLFFESDREKIYLGTNLEVARNFPHSEDPNFKETHYFRIDGLSDFEECNKHITTISRFLSFSTRNDINIEYISARANGNSVSILEKRQSIILGFKAKNMELAKMFFCLPRHKDKISQLYSSWINFTDSCTDFIDLYFYNPSNLLSDVFLRSAQSLEEIHRYNNKGSDKFGFKRRIESLFAEFDYVMNYTGEKEKFSQLIQDHRDYFSHWFEKKRHLILDGIKLECLARDANLLFELSILKNLDLNHNEIVHAVMHCQDYSLYLHWKGPEYLGHFPREIQWKNDDKEGE
ncbi:hypothetical protein GNP79_19565 [Aliivibrio fischeri]|uniref:Uncharacterized protein n=1 Tax=Aliivibrio fischeri TaxID=668 RepID=A0A6N3ZBC6_ALIFS|nr:HEPN domain-containing protein [Aliivibrio fischeri]MUK47545.1 hypothetical protein [Aliivibrio fischeri]MUK82972.1 hypothetical protein [Aliivibrio fischeri]MUK86643.1 hypothetical protein [Aliivibrio fischeri]